MLKSLKVSELEKTAEWMRENCLQSKLQIVSGSHTEVGMFFWSESGGVWLWLDLDQRCPMAVLSIDALQKKVRGKSRSLLPVHNFLEKHGLGTSLQNVRVDKSLGRCLYLDFSIENLVHLSLEVRLFPHGQNCIVHLVEGDKKVSLRKINSDVQPLKNSSLQIDSEVRSLEEIKMEWLESKKKKESSSEKDANKDLKNKIAKKKRAISKIEEGLKVGKEQNWKQLGDLLTEARSFDKSLIEVLKNIDQKFVKLVDKEQALSWNIENAFFKFKQGKKKKIGNEERLQILKKEVQDMEELLKKGGVKEGKAGGKSYQEKNKEETRAASLLRKGNAKGRTLYLEDGIVAFMGKSAADNLKILRAGKPWHTWLHLKDFPSAHVVIQHEKKQKINEKELRLVFDWLIKESSFGKKITVGEKLSVVVAEVRYVQPIKGAPVGAVKYSKSQNYRLKVE